MGQGWQQKDYSPVCAIHNQTGDVTQNGFMPADWVYACILGIVPIRQLTFICVEYYGIKMRLIFDMALKSILKGLQHVLLRRRMIAHKTYFCGFLNFAPSCAIIGGIGDIVIGFKSLAPDGTVGLYTYIFYNF